MNLADISFLPPEQVQLLADSWQPLFVLELTPLSETLIERGLLSSTRGVCPHSKRPCFVLKITQAGIGLISAWMGRQTNNVLGQQRDYEYDLEIKQYLNDVTKLVLDTAAQHGVLHVSQSFGGSPKNAAIVISLVACPTALALQVQEAIDRVVEEALSEFPRFEPTVH